MTKRGERERERERQTDEGTFGWWCAKFSPEEKKKAPSFDHHGCIIVMGQWRLLRCPCSTHMHLTLLFKNERILCHGCGRLGDIEWRVAKKRGNQALVWETAWNESFRVRVEEEGGRRKERGWSAIHNVTEGREHERLRRRRSPYLCSYQIVFPSSEHLTSLATILFPLIFPPLLQIIVSRPFAFFCHPLSFSRF